MTTECPPKNVRYVAGFYLIKKLVIRKLCAVAGFSAELEAAIAGFYCILRRIAIYIAFILSLTLALIEYNKNWVNVGHVLTQI